jgi:predicted nuclease of predicted toxin-antitoxin system
MRILADENLPRETVDALADAGHDIVWTRTEYPGAKDTDLMARAEADGRVLITLGKDFWQLGNAKTRTIEGRRSHPVSLSSGR